MPNFPEFPWDKLEPYAAEARLHPDGIIDLSVGSPVDSVPELVKTAMLDALDSHSYPQTVGTKELRQAIVDWYQRRRGVESLSLDNVMPTIGSKELVAFLPLLLDVGVGDTVVFPEVAYPTYEIGARLVGANTLASNNPEEWPDNTKLIWLNSPSNPVGSVLQIAQLKAAVDRARQLGAVIVNDECYIELGWDGPVPTILDSEVVGDSLRDVLSVYSLSKQSNLAGYRSAMVAGCRGRIAQIIAARKHLGLMLPSPVQAVMTKLLYEDEHVAAQKEIYRNRRAKLINVFTGLGFRIDSSNAGLYLWATRDENCWRSVAELAKHGILVTPGEFYGTAGTNHIRIALTVPDEKVDSIENRLEL